VKKKSIVSKLTSIIFILYIVFFFFLGRTNGCEDNIPTWRYGRRNLHEAARRILYEGKERIGMQVEKLHVWVKSITKDVV
jgi:hypothetical protein